MLINDNRGSAGNLIVVEQQRNPHLAESQLPVKEENRCHIGIEADRVDRNEVFFRSSERVHPEFLNFLKAIITN